MSVILPLTADLERRLNEEAGRLGIAPGAYAVQLLERQLTPKGLTESKIDMLQAWMHEGDEAEQRATGEFLIHSLDEDRPSDRKLFPPALKGISW